MMKRINNVLLLSAFVALTTNLIACNNIEDTYFYENNTSNIKWNEVADSATTALVEHFWHKDKHYFVYNSDEFDTTTDPGYWPQAHAMDVIIDAYQRTHDQKYANMFGLWYEGIKKVNHFRGASGLTTAKQLWTWIKTGCNDFAGGGIAWESIQHMHSKNACANGPAAIIAARLYKITNEKEYLDWALKIYNWEKATLFNPATGAIYDNINGNTNVIDKTTLSYNQGTFVGAAFELFKITGEQAYLNEARKAAYYCISDASMLDLGNNILRDEGNGDGGLFKGIFMRYFTLLIQEPTLDEGYKKKFTTFFNNNVAVLWQKGTNKQTLMMGPNWANAIKGTNQLTSQTSACMAIEAKATLK